MEKASERSCWYHQYSTVTQTFGISTVRNSKLGSGSGVVYKIEKENAFIVTNHHVIEGAKQVEVTLADGSKVEAKLVGSDIWTDLAVFQLTSKGIEYSC